MKSYFKLLKYSASITKFAPPFFILTLLSTVFGILNFTLLIPLLDILFNPGNLNNAQIAQPEFNMSTGYIKDVFDFKINELVVTQGKMKAIELIVLIIIASVILTNVFKYISSILVINFRLQTILNFRNALFNKLTNLQIQYFTTTKKGDIFTRVLGDPGEFENIITSSLSVIIRDPLKIIGFLIVLFNISTSLTFVTLTIIPISAIFISLISKKLKQNANLTQQSMEKIYTILDETVNGIRIILGFNAVEFVNKKFVNEHLIFNKKSKALAKRIELASPVSEILGSVMTGVILVYGGSLVLGHQSKLSAGEFVAFIIIVSQLLGPIKSLFNSIVVLQKGLVSGNRMLEIFEEPVLIKDMPNAFKLDIFKENVVFENVNFTYEKEPILKNISFEVVKGETVALVGPSGGGKSTIADLICRFYDTNSGSIKIDGHNITTLNIESLRNQMGIVSQESILFNDTVYNNIAFSKPSTSIEDVINAAKIANAHEFIENLEFGYNTLIGEKGLKLSGGQRQRISIARAVLKNPPILILDEATSALDTTSEVLVQEAINNLMKDRTVVVIAHRLSTIKNANKIIAISKGEIVEQGTHDELLANNGLYKILSESQFI